MAKGLYVGEKRDKCCLTTQLLVYCHKEQLVRLISLPGIIFHENPFVPPGIRCGLVYWRTHPRLVGTQSLIQSRRIVSTLQWFSVRLNLNITHSSNRLLVLHVPCSNTLFQFWEVNAFVVLWTPVDLPSDLKGLAMD